MKARLPKANNGSSSNLQQLAKQAQKMQQDMDALSQELDKKEYTKSSGGGAVSVTVYGNLELKSIDIKPEVVDPNDVEMLSDLLIAAINEALREAYEDKTESMEKISGKFNIPNIPGLF